MKKLQIKCKKRFLLLCSYAAEMKRLYTPHSGVTIRRNDQGGYEISLNETLTKSYNSSILQIDSSWIYLGDTDGGQQKRQKLNLARLKSNWPPNALSQIGKFMSLNHSIYLSRLICALNFQRSINDLECHHIDNSPVNDLPENLVPLPKHRHLQLHAKYDPVIHLYRQFHKRAKIVGSMFRKNRLKLSPLRIVPTRQATPPTLRAMPKQELSIPQEVVVEKKREGEMEQKKHSRSREKELQIKTKKGKLMKRVQKRDAQAFRREGDMSMNRNTQMSKGESETMNLSLSSVNPLSHLSQQPNVDFLTVKDMENLLKTSRTSLWRWEGDKSMNFPKRIRVTCRKVVWSKPEVMEWINSRPRGMCG